MRELSGTLDARGLRFGLALSRFNSRVGESLLTGAVDGLTRLGANPDDLTVVRVPGAWELPQALRWLAAAPTTARKRSALDGLVALGALIRGETPHFDQLAASVTRSLDQLASSSALPLAYGLVTCDSMEQAMERAGGKAGNKGFDAALAVVEMVQLRRALGSHG